MVLASESVALHEVVKGPFGPSPSGLAQLPACPASALCLKPGALESGVWQVIARVDGLKMFVLAAVVASLMDAAAARARRCRDARSASTLRSTSLTHNGHPRCADARQVVRSGYWIATEILSVARIDDSARVPLVMSAEGTMIAMSPDPVPPGYSSDTSVVALGSIATIS